MLPENRISITHIIKMSALGCLSRTMCCPIRALFSSILKISVNTWFYTIVMLSNLNSSQDLVRNPSKNRTLGSWKFKLSARRRPKVSIVPLKERSFETFDIVVENYAYFLNAKAFPTAKCRSHEIRPIQNLVDVSVKNNFALSDWMNSFPKIGR